MSIPELPDGFFARRPTVDDAPDIHELVAARDTAAIGVPDATVEDIADELAEPDFDLGADGWLVEDPGGRLVGWGWACRKGRSDNVDIEVCVRPGAEAIAPWLWATALHRSTEIARALGHPRAVVDIGIYRAAEAQRSEAQSRGFSPATTFHRLRIDQSGPRTAPEPPAGVTVRSDSDDESLRRTAHRVYQESFAEHFGFVPKSYEQWAAEIEASSTLDWSMATVAEVDGVPAALLFTGDQFVADENCGYIFLLAVLPEYRGMGLARFLLSLAFSHDAAKARSGTILHVDTENTTPALGLYLSAGMRPVLVIDVWRRVVPIDQTRQQRSGA
ncbi:MAG TPA: GNAT family N-acetyltransferase [Egibacteraceae bacterium]|nr:GNAT family N-acetyltransferase [Egibacteraceae bacterium]